MRPCEESLPREGLRVTAIVAAAILSHPLEAVIGEGRVAVHRPTRPARDTGAKWTLASARFAVENLLNRKALPFPVPPPPRRSA